MDGQPPVASDGNQPAYGDSGVMAVETEPEVDIDPDELDILNIAKFLFEETDVPEGTLQEVVIEGQATESGADHSNKAAAAETPLDDCQPGHHVDPTVDMEPEQLHILNIAKFLFPETDVPVGTLQDVVIEGQATEMGTDHGYKAAADYAPLDGSEPGHHVDPTEDMDPEEVHILNIAKFLFPETDVPVGTLQSVIEGQAKEMGADHGYKAATAYAPLDGSQPGRHVDPPPHLCAMDGPVYDQPYPAQVASDGTSPNQNFKHSTQRRGRRPAANWSPYALVPPQAYPHVTFRIKPAGGPLPTKAASTSQYISPPRAYLGATVASDGVGGGGGSSVPAQGTESGPSFNRPRNTRDTHNENGRRRRARLKTAFASLRHLVPGLSENSDNASVCERVAEYTWYMNKTLSDRFGRDAAKRIVQAFLDKFQPC